jgi:hypothetical protein
MGAGGTTVGDVNVLIGGDLSGWSAAWSKLEKDLDTFSAKAIRIGGTLSAISAPLVAVGVKSVLLAARLEQSTIAFSTLLKSGEKAQKFRAKLAKEPLPICARCCGNYVYGKWERPGAPASRS